ncbi:hypothetical protein AQUCO_03300097v1 [Aquilegia coerulea]|uniref:ZZ-type domain-containing protein n=1 Tax=Aquilegia coerulea TaxID=218851 RepID=A0A2G5CZG1_AQUCA|nr:hypothetical protein AQUCO_03300097v1 [Aquilegia coerulea]
MADALVSLVLENLVSISFVEIEEKERQKLTVLQDAEAKQVNDGAVKVWLEEFKDIAYDAEDILDEWNTKSLIRSMQQHPDLNASVIRKVRSHLFYLISCFKPIVIRHDIGNKIKKLNERLAGVHKKKESYNLSENLSEIQINGHRRITSDLVDAGEIYGRVGDKDVILSKILDESSHCNLHVSVISIVGTGGFGKTALAQLILQQIKGLDKFEMHIWVCVSHPFNLEKVVKEIIEQVEGIVPDILGWQALHKKLYDSVRGRPFFLVLDDVWSYSSNEWRQLKQALDGGANGSRILITTRDETVAMMMDSSYTHLLGQLSDADCWSLFKRITFSGREDILYKFEDIGKAISKKCDGVPLAARVVANLMRFKRTRQEWRDVLASDIWAVEENGEGFLPSILLSYYALPSYLKSCLMYCAVLPKGADIEKEEMVKLWMAHGYLGSNGSGSADLEMIGREYFDNLAKLSFFQDFKIDDESKITGCKMHDRVHDFVQLLTRNETIILEEEKVSSVKVRHLCARDLNWSSIYEQKNLRTLRSFPGNRGNSTIALELLHQLPRLRALSLRYCGIQKLPSYVGSLLLLRYLDLSDNCELVELPETICNLLNLQTLDLSGCKSLIRLPKGIAKLSSSLRHLCIKGCDDLNYMPLGVGQLSCLRTLEKFIVGGCDKEGKEKVCTIGELQLLNHLEGHLEIIWLEEVALNVSDAAQPELKMKEKLRSLNMNFSLEEEVVVGMEGALEGLQPHANLEKLKIQHFCGMKLPDWISSLSNLTELTLFGLPQCLQLPALGMLASLENLDLYGLKSVKSLGWELYGVEETLGDLNRSGSEQVVIFPKLKKLKMSSMPNLEEWDLPFQNGIDFFPNLSELIIDQLKGLQILPSLGKLKSLENLELSDMDGLSEWEEKMVVLRKEEEEESCIIMPCLSKLLIKTCPKLKIIPIYFFHALRDLEICNCPQLIEMQPSLPPFLEKLTLGYLTSSLLPLLHNNKHNYPNLNYFEISYSSQSSLPQGFNLLTSIRHLKFSNCKFLDFKPDDLKHLTMLQQLEASNCPILTKRFRKEDVSSSSSHSYKISIESSQPDVNVHIGIWCDNCEVNPIVGKRYKCKDCYDDLCEKCYITVNQHHRQGHKFDLIPNRGDSSVFLHPDDPSEGTS